MIKKVALSLITLGIVSFGAAGIFTQPVSAMASDPSCQQYENAVFGIVPWYRGLLRAPDCAPGLPSTSSSGGKSSQSITIFVMMIALNIIQAGLVVAAYVTVFYIMKGGFMYMTSTGSPEGMTNAKKTITNALIGLVIAVLSAAIVNAIAGIVQ